MKRPIIAVAGPTASGKTDLGKYLAQKYNGVVVSIDSRQIYTGLDIGTGKDKSFHQEMIDIINPPKNNTQNNTLEVITGYTSGFSVTQFVERALPIIEKIYQQNKLPIFVGGTGYYLDALLYTQSFPNINDPKIKIELEKMSTQELVNILTKLDPISVQRCQKNRRRLIRALEIVKTTGQPVSKTQKNSRFNHLLLILDPGKEKLDKLIELRMKKKFQVGMIDEVKQLLKKVDSKWLINLGLEYKYITLYLLGELSQPEMKIQLLTAEKQYSNRQRTWFRRYKEAIWIDNPQKAVSIVNKFVLTYNR